MVDYMKQVHRGAGIKMNRAGVSGKVTVAQTSPVVKNLGTYSFSDSQFYKVMPEGDYTFTVKETTGVSQVVSVRVEKDTISKNGNYLTID